MTRRAWLAPAMMILAACNTDARLTGTMAVSADSAVPPSMPAVERMEAVVMSRGGAPAPAPMDRKIIRTAELRIELDDVPRAARLADSIAARAGGEIAHSTLSQGDRGAMESQVTIRVPVTRFNEAMVALRNLGRVRVDNSGAEDVTRTYNDLEIRLRVKRETIERLRGLLATRAAKLSDIIEVERELSRAITELEQMEGERRYLDSQVAMSTINVSMYHAPIAGPGNFTDPILEAVRQSVAILGRSVGALISWTVFIAPWIVLAWIGWGIARAMRRRRSTPPVPDVNNA